MLNNIIQIKKLKIFTLAIKPIYWKLNYKNKGSV